MSPGLRRLLFPLALAAAAMALPPATSSTRGMAEAMAAAESLQHPEGRAPRNAPVFVATAERAATIALEAVGIPYRWGGESPSGGFDCSGLVRWAYGRVGVDVPHSSYALYGTGRAVSEARLEPGDVLFFTGLGHVGLYLGRGRMVHAPYSGKNVEVVRLDNSHYGRRLVGARRVVS